MVKSILFDCPCCQTTATLVLDDHDTPPLLNFDCPQCKKNIELTRLGQNTVHQCSVCNCKNLHQHKDFNKKLGLALFVIGAAFAPWTYYVSLVTALIIDACLYPFFPWMIVCYKCQAEFRGWPKNNRLDRFNHEVAAHFEYSK